MAERALPDLVSRISIDAAPLNAAASGIAGIFGSLSSRAESEGQKMEGSFNRVGGVMAGVGAAVAGAAIAVGANAVKMASEFDTATRSLAGSAQIPIESAQAIANSFLHSGEVTIFSAQEMVKALDPVSGQLELLTGHALTTADAHKVMSAAADLATATHTELGDTTKVLSSVMLAYHIPLSQAAEASSDLFETSRLVNVPLDDLQAILARLHARLGPIAPSLADTSTLMVDLAENGITGSRAINQVNTAMTTLLSGSPEVSAELQKLGIHVFDSSGHFVGLRSVIEQTQHAEKGMTDQQKLATDAIIFGGGSAKAMFQVIDGGVGTWDKAAAAVGTAGAAHKAAGDVMGGVEGQGKLLKKSMDDLQVSIGQGLTPALNKILGALNPVVDKMAKWAADNPNEATGIILVAGALGALIPVIWAVNIAIAANPIVLIAVAIIAAIVLIVGGILWLHAHWNQVIKFFEDHQWVWIAVAAGMMLLLGPIGLLIVAGFFLATHWQQAMALFKEIIADVVAFFTGNWQRVHDWFRAAISAIVLFFTSNWQRVHDWFAGIISAIVLTFTSNWQRVHDFTVGVFSAIWGFLVGVWNGIYGAVAGAVNAIWGFITAAFGAIWLFLRTWGLVIVAIIATPFILAYQAIAPIVVGIWNFISGVFTGIYNTISGWLSAAFNFIVGHLVQAYLMFQFYWTFIWNVISGIVAGIHNTIAGWLSAIYNFIVGHLVQAWNVFQFYWTFIWNTISGIWNGIWGTISHWAETILNTIKKWVQDNWDTIYYWFTFIHTWIDQKWNGIWGTISHWAETILNTIKKWVQDNWDTIYYWFTFIHTWIDQKWNGIWGTISYWAGRVRDTVGDVFNSLGTIVHKALEDLGYQVGKDVNWIIHRVNDFLDKVWATFHGFGIDLPIHDIPHLEGYPYAEGGIVDRPTHAIVGEAGHPETIIPWDPAKRDQALDLWQTTGLALGAVPLSGAREGKGAGPNLDNIPTSGHGGQCLAFLSQYFPQLRGIPAAKDAASLINSNTAKPGEVAINTSIAPYGHAALVINPPNMVLDSNWDEHENIMIHPLADVKAAGFIDFGATLGTLAGGAAGGIFDVAQLINQLIDQVLAGAGAGPQWLSGTLPAILKNMAGPQLIDWIKKNFAAQISKLTSSVAGAFSAIKGAFAGGVDQWITQGEQLAGVGDDWHAALKARIGVESGGDPNIDQSGLTGYAQAHGIMQMINSTFAAYALPGHTNIYNPVDNIAAAIRYIEKRYGGWQGMPPLTQGYDQGGVFPSGTIGYNASGKDEYVFTKDQVQGLGGGPPERVLELLESIEKKVMGHLEVNTYGTNLTPRDVAREIVQEVRAI